MTYDWIMIGFAVVHARSAARNFFPLLIGYTGAEGGRFAHGAVSCAAESLTCEGSTSAKRQWRC